MNHKIENYKSTFSAYNPDIEINPSSPIKNSYLDDMAKCYVTSQTCHVVLHLTKGTWAHGLVWVILEAARTTKTEITEEQNRKLQRRLYSLSTIVEACSLSFSL